MFNKCDAAPESAAQQARAALCGRGLFRAVFCGSAKTGEGLDALEAAGRIRREGRTIVLYQKEEEIQP